VRSRVDDEIPSLAASPDGPETRPRLSASGTVFMAQLHFDLPRFGDDLLRREPSSSALFRVPFYTQSLHSTGTKSPVRSRSVRGENVTGRAT
jgi:hypothetical protein